MDTPVCWKFFDYVEGNTNPIEDWYEGLSADGKELFQSLLKNIKKTEIPSQWIGWKRFLKGKLEQQKIWELEFRADKRQYRVLGQFGKERRTVILLIGCYHKQGNYTPTDTLHTAEKRAKSLQQGKGGTREREIQSDY